MDLLKKIEVEVKVVFVLQKFCYEIEHVHPKCERLEIMHLHPKNVFETLFENFLPGTLKGQKGRGPRNDALATQSRVQSFTGNLVPRFSPLLTSLSEMGSMGCPPSEIKKIYIEPGYTFRAR